MFETPSRNKRYFQKSALRKRGEIILEKHGYLKKTKMTALDTPAFKGFRFDENHTDCGNAFGCHLPSNEFCNTALKSVAKSQFTKSIANLKEWKNKKREKGEKGKKERGREEGGREGGEGGGEGKEREEEGGREREGKAKRVSKWPRWLNAKIEMESLKKYT